MFFLIVLLKLFSGHLTFILMQPTSTVEQLTIDNMFVGPSEKTFDREKGWKVKSRHNTQHFRNCYYLAVSVRPYVEYLIRVSA